MVISLSSLSCGFCLTCFIWQLIVVTIKCDRKRMKMEEDKKKGESCIWTQTYTVSGFRACTLTQWANGSSACSGFLTLQFCRLLQLDSSMSNVNVEWRLLWFLIAQWLRMWATVWGVLCSNQRIFLQLNILFTMCASCFGYPQCYGAILLLLSVTYALCKALSWKSLWIKASPKWIHVNVFALGLINKTDKR